MWGDTNRMINRMGPDVMKVLTREEEDARYLKYVSMFTKIYADIHGVCTIPTIDVTPKMEIVPYDKA